MTRVLIVDDDAAQLRSLARSIAARRDDLTVVTAGNGVEAIRELEAGAVDLVLTDIQMPEMNGFELLAWMLKNQPHVSVFTMTAYPDHESMARLRELGDVECFTKPLDVQTLIDRLSETVSDGMRGHVRNISLASFLQLIEIERKTCTLVVESGQSLGHLYLWEGSLVDARTASGRGEAAAYAIMAWPAPAITILSHCATEERTVDSPMSFIIMEAMRLKDEAEHSRRGEPVAPASDPFAQLEDEEMEAALWVSDASPAADDELATIELTEGVEAPDEPVPQGTDAIVLLDLASGETRVSVGELEMRDALAQVVWAVYDNEQRAVGRLAPDQRVQELVVTTAQQWWLARAFPAHGLLGVLVFDPATETLVMQRRVLDDYVGRAHAQG